MAKRIKWRTKTNRRGSLTVVRLDYLGHQIAIDLSVNGRRFNLLTHFLLIGDEFFRYGDS